MVKLFIFLCDYCEVLKPKNKMEAFFFFFSLAAPEFRIWSPTTLLGQALSSLTTVDRTGNGAFC